MMWNLLVENTINFYNNWISNGDDMTCHVTIRCYNYSQHKIHDINFYENLFIN
jgi:putative component of membrane protein insertase Oxa1/YidC/SpoIIIJ protein YidD